MRWFHKILPNPILGSKDKNKIPEGLWMKCDNCSEILYRSDLEKYQHVCKHCNNHIKIAAKERLLAFLDIGSSKELFNDISPLDPLKFRDQKKYTDRLSEAQNKTKEKDGLVVFHGTLNGMSLVVAAFEFDFMGGSMGSVVGEKFVRATEFALKNKTPFICFSASGGARMQEGMISLMQMAKTATAIGRMNDAKLPFISVLTNPTMGGVTASLAMLGDIILAEPGAIVGFAGKRVIENIVKQQLPEGFQTAEFLLEHGSIDAIVDRRKMQSEIFKILKILRQTTKTEALPKPKTNPTP